MALVGWPVTNFASEYRNLGSHGGNFAARRVALAIPRYKYTFLAEFQITPGALNGANTLTRIGAFMNGKIYGQLKQIDYPRATIKNEKIRSYNKYRIVSTHAEYTPFQMVFHDDAASLSAALWKEYWNFYHETGNIGNDPTSIQRDRMKFSANEQLTGANARNEQQIRASLGMRLRPTNMRHFFESITIYDLGTEPDSVNVYTFYRPVLNQIDHDPYDNEDRTGKMTMTWSLDCEGYFFTIGQNLSLVENPLINQLGLDQARVVPSVGHAIMKPRGTARQNTSTSVVPSTPDPLRNNPNLSVPRSPYTPGLTPAGGSGNALNEGPAGVLPVSEGVPLPTIPGRPETTPNLSSPDSPTSSFYTDLTPSNFKEFTGQLVAPNAFDLTPSAMKELTGNSETQSAVENTKGLIE